MVIADVLSEVERKFFLMLVDKTQLRLSRTLDTVMRRERFSMVYLSEL